MIGGLDAARSTQPWEHFKVSAIKGPEGVEPTVPRTRTRSQQLCCSVPG